AYTTAAHFWRICPAASRSDRCAKSARRLYRPVRSSCSASLRSSASAVMRACSWASNEATVWLALSSSLRHFFFLNFTHVSCPVVTPPEISGAATTEGDVILTAWTPQRSCAAAAQRATVSSDGSGRTIFSFLPCSHSARTGSALLK